jgi:BirA family biotin operon repressor/biotin-[acetyl-CoA-carboxylase] ligase
MELKPQPDSTIVCLAEQQEAGKGRRGKTWVSPFGKNIYLSVGTKFRRRTSELGGLSLVIGIQVIKTLRNLGLDNIGLKWPNDVLLLKGKLAGILVELKREHQGDVFVVIGIGVNFELEEKHSESIDQPWSELKPHITLSRNDVAGQLVNNMLMALEVFESLGFSAFRDEWNESNLYRGREVIVHLGEEQISGRDAGVDNNGNLLLETTEGMRVFAAGQVSLRPAV